MVADSVYRQYYCSTNWLGTAGVQIFGRERVPAALLG